MNKTDLQHLIANLNDSQAEIVAGFVIRVVTAAAEKWTGQINFSVNLAQGSMGDMGVSRNEVVRLTKKRGVRSGGL